VPAGEPAAEPARAPREVLETLHARAELLDRATYRDYEKATFSFEHGLRDDPENRVTHNDWDLQFTNGRFDVAMVTDDQSLIVDLGAVPLRDLWAWNAPLEAPAERAPVRAGHSYFVWTRDGDSDLASAFEVLEHVPDERCVLEWYATKDGARAKASVRDGSPGRRLAAKLLEWRRELRRPQELVAPRVWLQGRNGSGGGNPYRAFVSGETERFDQRAGAPLDLFAPIGPRERGTAYCEGGFVPEGKVFVVTRATYWGTAAGDGNGPGRFAVVLGELELVEHAAAEPVSGTWTGRVELRPEGELEAYLELKNSSAGEVILSGHFEDE
jgi:hypothetical protein